MIEDVKEYWEQEACGTHDFVVQDSEEYSREWFEKVEEFRYSVEPFIHAEAQFTRHKGKKLLEIGVGAGTDHLQWARAGAICHGVDLTDRGINTTRRHLALYGLESKLQRVNSEVLPFEDGFFDVVYSWGVIHHSEHPEKIIAEIHRVLKPGGVFIGMLYNRYSFLTFRLWVRYALLSGKPWRTFSDVLWHHCESLGTKAYTAGEVKNLYKAFSEVSTRKVVTPHDYYKYPKFLIPYFPDRFGWFINIHAKK
jgi:ubiquinone/menaquinone biosynthesis C-methylase UbiE